MDGHKRNLVAQSAPLPLGYEYNSAFNQFRIIFHYHSQLTNELSTITGVRQIKTLSQFFLFLKSPRKMNLEVKLKKQIHWILPHDDQDVNTQKIITFGGSFPSLSELVSFCFLWIRVLTLLKFCGQY